MIPSQAFYFALSEVIKERRLHLGLDQKQAAQLTGLVAKTISANENLIPPRSISLDNLLRYCHAYEVEVQGVLLEAERRTPAIAARMAEKARQAEEARVAEERRALRPEKRVSLKRSATTSGALRSSLDPNSDYVVLIGTAGR
jgi:transcriptional regulator with XRE-family HTH domain